ncbi:hypothetical protein TA3x_004273 [Tundrisphaera sp. TA3]|uniref:hypothetical protein n=1 Tax=Tundrisphaera sp. TA3 TaxID=3435775 RepID=UPI003EBAD046
MAIDQTSLAMNLCTKIQTAADEIMRGVTSLAALKEQKESAGVDFTAVAFETALSNSTLKHANGDAFNSVISSGTLLKAWLEENYHDDNFQKVRGG